MDNISIGVEEYNRVVEGLAAHQNIMQRQLTLRDRQARAYNQAGEATAQLADQEVNRLNGELARLRQQLICTQECLTSQRQRADDNYLSLVTAGETIAKLERKLARTNRK